ncbi:MAG: tyrosine-type recombinase/integrase [Mariprofundales bacterium]
MKIKFTDRSIRSLKKTGERYEVWKYGGQGFGIRISKNGKKSWFLLYRFQGKSRRITFGSYPAISLADANALHANAVQSLEKGIDPSLQDESMKHRQYTIEFLIDEYITRWAKERKRSWKEDERQLKKDVLPRWGTKYISDIKKYDVIELLDNVLARGAPVAANRLLAVIRKMFNFGIGRDLIEYNPCAMISQPAPETSCDRVLSNDEIRLLWHANDLPLQSKLVMQMQLATAQRKGEVVTALWEHIENGWWVIPLEIAKNKRRHTIPLSPIALAIIVEIKQLNSTNLSPYLFPACRKPLSHMRGTSVSHALLLWIKKHERNRFTPHDLRRTAASKLAEIGVQRAIISKILNHADNEVTAIYDRYDYAKEKVEAMEKLSISLEDIIA